MTLSDLAVRSVLTRSGPSALSVPSDRWAFLLTTPRPRRALRTIGAWVRAGWVADDPGALVRALLALLSDPGRPARVVLRTAAVLVAMDRQNLKADRRASIPGTEVKTMSVTFNEWITARHACAVMGINYKCLRRLVDQGKVTVRDLGGCKCRYSQESCERLLKTSVRPATTHV